MSGPARAPSADELEAQRRRAEREATPDARMRLTWNGRVYELSQASIGPGDDAKCRAQTAAYTGGAGWTLTGLMAAASSGNVAEAGADVVAVVLWTVRCKNGEPDLKLAEVFDSVSMDDLVNMKLEVVTDDLGEGEPPGE
jgi:hypothetical protein